MEAILTILAIIIFAYIIGKVLKFTFKTMFAIVCIAIAVILFSNFGII